MMITLALLGGIIIGYLIGILTADFTVIENFKADIKKEVVRAESHLKKEAASKTVALEATVEAAKTSVTESLKTAVQDEIKKI